jgi:hypothetical protein
MLWCKCKIGLMHMFYNRLKDYSIVRLMICLHCILDQEKCINSIHSCVLNFLCTSLQHEPDVELQNWENKRSSRSYQIINEFFLYGTAEVINVEGSAIAHCLYVVSCPDSKLFIVGSHLYTASDSGQSAHCVKAYVLLFLRSFTLKSGVRWALCTMSVTF